jgi:hypothetical protein
MDKVKNKYIFPNFLASMMSKVDMRTQYEASMMSMSLIMVGLVVSGFYLWVYTMLPLWYKIFLMINVFAGIIFLSSFVITTYQQYITYMKALEFQKQMKGGNQDAKKNIW